MILPKKELFAATRVGYGIHERLRARARPILSSEKCAGSLIVGDRRGPGAAQLAFVEITTWSKPW